jgi:hypothetical protein
MDSTYLKVALLHKLRFTARNLYLATEVGAFGADVATITGNKLIEYETKISVSDFRADFKKGKHNLYLGKEPQGKRTRYHSWIPHQFYFVVPGTIADKVAPLLLPYPNYGLIVIKEKAATKWALREIAITVRRAKLLHTNTIQPQVYQAFLLRMGSEIASLSTLKLRSDYVDQGSEDKEAEASPEYRDPESIGLDSSELQPPYDVG